MRNGGKVAPGKVLLPRNQRDSIISASSARKVHDDNNNRKQKKFRPKLPSMYPLGPPQAASSPIHPSAKNRSCFIFEDIKDVMLKKTEEVKASIKHISRKEGNAAAPLAVMANQNSVNAMWRPW